MDLDTLTSPSSWSPSRSSSSRPLPRIRPSPSHEASIQVQNASEISLQEQAPLLAKLESTRTELEREKEHSESLTSTLNEERAARKDLEAEISSLNDTLLETAAKLAELDPSSSRDISMTRRGDGADLARTVLVLADRAARIQTDYAKANTALRRRVAQLESSESQSRLELDQLTSQLEQSRRAAASAVPFAQHSLHSEAPRPSSGELKLLRKLIEQEERARQYQVGLIAQQMQIRSRTPDDLERRIDELAEQIGSLRMGRRGHSDDAGRLVEEAERIFQAWDRSRTLLEKLARRG